MEGFLSTKHVLRWVEAGRHTYIRPRLPVWSLSQGITFYGHFLHYLANQGTPYIEMVVTNSVTNHGTPYKNMQVTISQSDLPCHENAGK